jgi:hypothetical protein
MTKRTLRSSKKGESRMLTPWMFLVLGLIGIAIVAAVTIFFSASIDLRFRESNAMSDKLVYAIFDNGYLKGEVLAPGYDILKSSGISNRSMDSGFFYLNVTIYDGSKVIQTFIYGNNDFEIQCRLNGDKLAKCYDRQLTLIDRIDSSKIYTIKIFSGSNSKAL